MLTLEPAPPSLPHFLYPAVQRPLYPRGAAGLPPAQLPQRQREPAAFAEGPPEPPVHTPPGERRAGRRGGGGGACGGMPSAAGEQRSTHARRDTSDGQRLNRPGKETASHHLQDSPPRPVRWLRQRVVRTVSRDRVGHGGALSRPYIVRTQLGTIPALAQCSTECVLCMALTRLRAEGRCD
eukprot:363761-Chlamydomonas_euryale.AAC.16